MNSFWLPIAHRHATSRRLDRSRGKRGLTPSAIIERLEGRALLTLTVTPITPMEGSLFQGQVATFDGTEVTATTILDFSATIDWGDGTPTTSGAVIPGTPNGYVVNGSHTYTREGIYNLSVVLNGTGGTSVTSVGTARVSDAPVIVSAGGISATANGSFSGQVATFTDAGPDQASQYVATVTWGDGTTTPGVVAAGADSTSFTVSGTHTYTSSGSQIYSVSVTNLAGTTGTAQAKATIADPAPVVSVPTIVPMEDVPFTGEVASFEDADPTLSASSFTAIINWGDSPATTLGTVTGSPSAGFTVTGTHTYTSIGVFPTQVTVYRLPDNTTGQASGSAVVNSAVSVTPGGLAPASDTGESNRDGITSINQPTYTGSVPPFSIVQLYTRRADQSGPVLQGTTIAGPDGRWNLQVGPLADGWYAVSVTATPPSGSPLTTTALQPLVIDTVAPQVTGVLYSPRTHMLQVTFRDSQSGMNLNTIRNPAYYNLIGHPQRRFATTTPPTITTLQIVPSDPQAVVITLNNSYYRTQLRTLRVLSGGVADVAGNALDGVYRGRFPSGNGHPGSNFVIPLSKAARGYIPNTSMPASHASSHRRGR
jgi:hypothetical protein